MRQKQSNRYKGIKQNTQLNCRYTRVSADKLPKIANETLSDMSDKCPIK